MAAIDSHKSKKHVGSSPRLLQEYIEALQSQLSEEQEQKEALSLERAKLKVCWEMTLEELANTRSELTEKIINLESELHKQFKRRKLLQKLIMEYEKNLDEMKGVIENIIERPKCCFIKKEFQQSNSIEAIVKQIPSTFKKNCQSMIEIRSSGYIVIIEF